jgi:hypothetical protein
VNLNDVGKAAKRIWIGIAILTVVLCLYPVEYRVTRLAFVTGAVATWGGALLLCWKRKALRAAFLFAAVVPALAVCLPARAEVTEESGIYRLRDQDVSYNGLLAGENAPLRPENAHFGNVSD